MTVRTDTACPADTALPADLTSDLTFDVHGLVTMGVHAGAPGARQLAEMFGAFRTGAARPPYDIAVDDEPSARMVPADATVVGAEYAYTTDSVHVAHQRLRVTLQGDSARVSGPGEHLTTVVPLLDVLLAQRDVAMIHAAVVDVGGVGVALPAAGGTGKTSVVARFLRTPGVRFMADDWAFLTATGTLLGYAKPMFLKPHHRGVYPEQFRGAHKPLVPSRLTEPIGRLTTLVHPAMVRRPRLAAVARRWSPEHRMVTAASLFGPDAISPSAPLGLCVYVERSTADRPELAAKSPAWMAGRMAGNFHAELPGPSHEVMTALAASGLLALDDHYATKTAVLRRALEGHPTYLLRVPRAMPPAEAAAVIDRHVSRLLGEVPAP